jgi:hypothetical protein
MILLGEPIFRVFYFHRHNRAKFRASTLQSPGVMAWQGQESGDKIISPFKWVTAVAFWPETFFIKRQQRTKEAAD